LDVFSRFNSKVRKDELTGCHEWQAAKSYLGYGKFYFDYKDSPAHRVAYLLFVGEIPEKAWVLHKCDNRKCVNPEHLYLGDAIQNAKDRTDRARWTHERLPKEQVDAIRERYAAGELTQQQLADEYKCHQTQISRIIRHTQRKIK
jgi:hypothetical protein